VDSCFTEGSLVVSVEKDRSIYVPNVFTPNSDALNDRLTVYGGKQVEKIVSFIIYDRWGELVFKAEDFLPNDLNEGWDGLFKGKEATGGIYAYLAVVEYLDGEQFSFPGEVLIMR
jgi:gliding motility-associated-like protein